MVITKHIARVRTVVDNDSSEKRVKHVVEDNAIPNTSGSPTLADYIALELASGFPVNHREDDFIVTISAADVNAA